MSQIAWSKFPEYDEIVAKGYLSGLSSREIAGQLYDTFGVTATKDQVTSRIGRIARGQKDEADPAEAFRQSVDAEKQRAEQRAFAREMASAVQAQVRWEELLSIFRDGITLSDPLPISRLEIPTGSGTPEDMVVIVSDIHIGKLVDPSVVGDEFGYGFPIFKMRGELLLNRILRLYALHSNTAFIKKIRIYFLGDGVDGTDMRRGQAHRNDIQSATSQTLVLFQYFDWLIKSLRASLGVDIEVIWDYGNHGRVGDFGVNLPADNWDYIAGSFLQVSNQDRQVLIDVRTQKYHITQLGPLRVYSSHGDGVKGGDGFAGLPINGMARALAKDTGLHKQLFDLYLMGHFHTPQLITTQAGRIVMNGSWDGGDDYSINQLKAASQPSQWAFGVHPDRGVTWLQEIELAPKRKPTEVLL